jgi:hypothetical protein
MIDADLTALLKFWTRYRAAVVQRVCVRVVKLTSTWARSCSRPPLLGFSKLYPRMCISQVEGGGERLPTR